jgi:hypothetical protein
MLQTLPIIAPTPRAVPYLPCILIFLTVFFIYSLSLVGGMNSLDQVNYALTKAIVEEHTIFLDVFEQPPSDQYPYGFNPYTFNIDYAISQHGRTVADREPGISIIGLPFYILGRALAPITNMPYNGVGRPVTEESKLQIWTYLSEVFVIGLGFALLFYCLSRLGIQTHDGLLTVFTIAFGSLVWKYSTSFSRHPVVAICLLLAVSMLLLYCQATPERNLYVTLAGIFMGIAAVTDYVTWITSASVAAMIIVFARSIKPVVLFLAGLLPFLFSACLYNYTVFGELITSPHSHEGHFSYMTVFENNFRTPIHWGLWLNLFSFGPIPAQAIQWLLDHEGISHTVGAEWAMKWHYKGIFVQSPVLFFAFIGWYRQLRRNGGSIFSVLAPLLMFLSIFIPMSMNTLFWGTNTYDGRYLVGAAPLLFLGLAYGGSTIKNPVGAILFRITLYISVFFAFESMVTNFGPNLSGEHRYSLAKLFTPLLTRDSLIEGAIEAFPNMYNAHLMLVTAAGLCFLVVIPTLRLLQKLEAHAFGRCHTDGDRSTD